MVVGLAGCQAHREHPTPDYHSSEFESQRTAASSQITALLSTAPSSPLIPVAVRTVDTCDTSGAQNQISFVDNTVVQTFCDLSSARLFALSGVTDPTAAAVMADAFMAEKHLATDQRLQDQPGVSTLVDGPPIVVGDRVSPNVNLVYLGDVTRFTDSQVIEHLPDVGPRTTTTLISDKGALSAASALEVAAAGSTFFMLVELTREYHFEGD
ncbi:hypothetical protein BH09ACT6_BH09ACT6_22590 [soil metagenome]